MRIKTLLYFMCMVGIAVMLAVWMRNRRAEASSGPSRPEIVVFAAIDDLPVGTFIEERLFVSRSWDNTMADPRSGKTYVTSETALKELSGSVLKNSKKSGEVLTELDLVRPGDFAFLSAVLTPGSRAITIRTDDVTGGAGLIQPGNRVDVILSGPLENKTAGLRSGTPVARTILTDVKVIAINRQAENAPAETVGSVQARNAKPGEKGTATLEVSPKEAEVLAVAKTMGDLSLSLRSLVPAAREGEDAASLSITKSTELIPDSRPPQTEESEIVMMYGTEIRR